MDIKGGKFLITGGASLIGSHITEKLLEAGAAEVVLFDNYALGSAETVRELLVDDRIKLVRGDILQLHELMEQLQGVDGAYAVAAFLTLPLARNPIYALDVNVRGHMNLLEACRWAGVKKVVFSSSVATYGTSAPGVINETTPFTHAGAPAAGTLYATSKIMGENLCRLYHERYGLDYIALRYSTVYGERQHYRGINALYIIETYDALKRGQRPVLPDDGSEVHDYVYVGDLARANVLAMQSDASGESINICTGVDTSLNDIVDVLLKITGSDLKPEYRTDPTKVRFTASSVLNFTREKADRLLGWAPKVSFEEGVRRLIAWHDARSAEVANK